MKITMEKQVRCYENMPYKSKNRGIGIDAVDAGKNRDSIFIASSISEFKEKQIVGEAVGRVMTDIRSSTPRDKIEALKRQIAEGTYQPDPEQIAACMLAGRRPVADE
ncbi:MAG: flagellar biosynthesis anti-sigma factor FlgM [Lachnospiraceae bacterium]|nr:flagellar biosynthesis anti-sigma factor FlgM [Lachnospiraceae bacterium]